MFLARSSSTCVHTLFLCSVELLLAAVHAHLRRLALLAKQLRQQVLGALDHILPDLLLALRK